MTVFYLVSWSAVDGHWSAWNSWSYTDSCSVSCGEGTRTRTRTRKCNNPSPRYGGKTCRGKSTKSHDIKCRQRPCSSKFKFCNSVSKEYLSNYFVFINSVFISSVTFFTGDGMWSSWSKWVKNGQCSVTCGEGVKKHTRIRSCNNPAPQNGGKDCVGISKEITIKQCTEKVCPLEGACYL